MKPNQKLKKFKHNKKRNTAFLYEALCNELTKTIVAKDTPRQARVMRILQEHFHKGTQLYTELQLYGVLTDTKELKPRVAEKMVSETRKEHDTKVDRTALFVEQSRLIKRINIELGGEVYSNFVPDYKTLATIAQIFGGTASVKDRVILEEKIVAKMSTAAPEEKPLEPLEHVDNLVFKTFTEKFNQTYKQSLHEEQQQVLMRYIFSFSDGGISLNEYLNEEIGRLRDAVTESLTIEEIKSDSTMLDNAKRVLAILEEYKTTPINEGNLKRLLKIQELVREVA
tara:strand:- start:23 stop:871 length:849 start_codon:yes stop_codon:yes gene_type:complete